MLRAWLLAVAVGYACVAGCTAAEAAIEADGGVTAQAYKALQRQVAELMGELEMARQEAVQAQERIVTLQSEHSVVTEHYERRVRDLQAKISDSDERLRQEVELNQHVEAQLKHCQDDSSREKSDKGHESEGSTCDCATECPTVTARPAKADNEGLRDEIEELYRQELARQRRLQHEDADSADNGPKEISIHCHSQVSVSIVDLDADQRDQNECLVLNLNGQDVSSRLVLYCDGTTNASEEL